MEIKIEEILMSGPVEAVGVFNVNNTYFEIENENLWIIDGAFQVKYPESCLQMGWSPMYNMFIPTTVEVKPVAGQLNFKELTQGAIPKLHNLRGKKIIDHSSKWVSFEVWDDEADAFVEEHALVELLLTFESNEKLQIATVAYQMLDSDTPGNFRYDPMAELLISLNTIIEIPPLK
jgi:hypothetical protein